MEFFFDFIWLIPVYPLLTFIAIVVFQLNRNQKASAGMTVAMIALATVHSWIIVFNTVGAYMSAPAHGPEATHEEAAPAHGEEAAPAHGEEAAPAHGEEAAPAHGEDESAEGFTPTYGEGSITVHAETPTVCTGGAPIHIEGCDKSFNWIPTGKSWFVNGFAVDGFTALMLFMVPFVCTLIFTYATEYMEGYEEQFGRYSRFFAYVSLFAAGMLTLVIANNLLLLFIAWEIMGLCSYLLIGFWFERSYENSDFELETPRNFQTFVYFLYPGPDKIAPKLAALKAFMTTRVGDVLFFCGLMLLWSYAGTLTFREVFQPAMLTYLTETTLWGIPVATLSSLLIFGGAVGKSAQFPLHVWLPDAMEGPTPVSALIHAATMVSAGVYLVARMLPLFATVEGSPTLQWVAIIGAITAVMGATIGMAQYDVKRVLAYSTISQLGYMMMALGLGGFFAGAFHMLSHAFFKALLFMGSGSIIHAMEHGAHHIHHMQHGHGDGHHDPHAKPHDAHHADAHADPHADSHHDAHHADAHHDEEHFDPHSVDPQDMRNMGGLRNKMKASFYAYLFGTLALVGVFPFAGFWSKDEILAEAFMHAFDPHHPSKLALMVYIAGSIGAVFTAFYMGRQIGLVFYGKPRTPLAEHAHEPGWRMTMPLVVLAVFSLGFGFLNIPEDLGGNAFLHHFAGDVHEIAAPAAPALNLAAVPFNYTVAIISSVLGLVSFAFGWWLYSGLETAESPDFVERIPVVGKLVFTILRNKYYFDELYRGAVIYPTVDIATFCGKFDYDWIINPIVNLVGRFTVGLSDVSAEFDRLAVDGLGVNGIPQAFNWFGGLLRQLQTGRAQSYLLILVVGLLILAGIYLALILTGAGASVALLP
jgi:NADH-quinone oxidoreductase subunit L